MSSLQNFLVWIQLKFRIHSVQNRPLYFKEREVWWCHFGENVGDEERWKWDQCMRPVVIMRKFNNNLALVVPTSTVLKENKFYTSFEYGGGTYSALISHLRTLDTKRLNKKIATLSEDEYTKIHNSIVSEVLKIKIDPSPAEADKGYMANANL